MSIYPAREKSFALAASASITALITLLGFFAPPAALAQVPEPRVVASFGVPDPADPNNVGKPVWETGIAAGPNEVISVYHQEINAQSTSAVTIGFAIFNRTAGAWTEQGIIPTAGDGTKGGFDPSVVWVGGDTNDFLACSVVSKPAFFQSQTAIGVARYSNGAWTPWEAVTSFITAIGYSPYDKPWLLAGGEYEDGRELYITFWRDAGGWRHSYLRSRDGGDTWTLGDITFGLGGDLVEALPAGYQPTVAGDGHLYIAYTPPLTADTREIRLLVGVDIDDPNDPHDGEVEFSKLLMLCPLGEEFDPPEPPELVVTRNRAANEFKHILPGGAPLMDFVGIPWLAADPTDAGRLYLAYHDTETDDPNDTDVNVYLHVLTRQTGGRWCAGDRVRVNDDNTENESDQFMPQVVVDDEGGVHIIFYDDRKYTDDPNDPGVDQQPDGTASPRPKFDVFYAYSDDGGLSFEQNRELAKDPNGLYPNETCLDYELLQGFDFASKPGDYNGIVAFGDEVWTCFTGTSQEELDDNPDSNPSAIWSSLIRLVE